MSLTLGTVTAAIQSAGLAYRGAFHPAAGEGVPDCAPDTATATVVLVGMIGRAQWSAFETSREAGDGAPHPLDRWSRRLLGELAATFAGRALDPSTGPPFWPFQRWAQRADTVTTSPLGLLLHTTHGLWHSYRGALLLRERLPLPPAAATVSPCAACVTRPCLSACPVNAFSTAGFDALRCAAFLDTPAGESCLTQACAARRACPVGREEAQGPAQARFHLQAFLRSRRD